MAGRAFLAPAPVTPPGTLYRQRMSAGKSGGSTKFGTSTLLRRNLRRAVTDSCQRGASGEHSRLAVGIDVRSRGDLAHIPQWLSAVGALGFDPRLVFFDTRDEVLLKRYSDTRRRHPLTHLGLALADAIALERQVLKPLRTLADVIIDTSDLNVHQLRRRVITELGLAQDSSLSLLFESFAYRHGVPADADFVFDVRALPNPHWDARLRPLSGRDQEVREYLEAQDDVREYLAQVSAFLSTWLPRMGSATRSYVTVALGCTGGRHRSVYLAEALADLARTQGWGEVATSTGTRLVRAAGACHVGGRDPCRQRLRRKTRRAPELGDTLRARGLAAKDAPPSGNLAPWQRRLLITNAGSAPPCSRWRAGLLCNLPLRSTASRSPSTATSTPFSRSERGLASGGRRRRRVAAHRPLTAHRRQPGGRVARRGTPVRRLSH